MSDGGVEHALDADVHAEEWLAGADFGNVVARSGLSDVAPILRGFEL